MSLKLIAEIRELRNDLYKAMEEIANLKGRVYRLENPESEQQRKVYAKGLKGASSPQ